MHSNEVRAQVNKQQDVIKTIEEQTKEISKKINSSTQSQIGILSLFSAVAMTFFGGFNITGVTLKDLQEVSTENIMITLAILGTILFNTIFLLLKFIHSFTETSADIVNKVFQYVNCAMIVTFIIGMTIKFVPIREIIYILVYKISIFYINCFS